MLWLLVIFCFGVFFEPSPAQASKIDDIFEAIVENSFRKVGKKMDDLAALRKGDSFSTLLRKNDDFADLLKTRKLVDDDIAGLRRIGFPPGSRYADEFMTLPKAERVLGYALNDATSRIARLPAGDDMVKRLGKKGLLTSGIYGDDFARGAYAIARQDEFWNAARHSLRVVDQDNADLMRFIQRQNLPGGGYQSLRRISDFDPVDLTARVMRTYGPRGVESLKDFMRKVGKFMKENPKKSAAGILIAMVYINPSLILDPVGKLKDNAVDGLLMGLAEIGGEAAAGLSVLPMGMAERFTERLFSDWPVFMKSMISYIMAFVFLMGFFYVIPFTRFIPKKIFSWVASIRLSRREKTPKTSKEI